MSKATLKSVKSSTQKHKHLVFFSLILITNKYENFQPNVNKETSVTASPTYGSRIEMLGEASFGEATFDLKTSNFHRSFIKEM